MKLLRVAATAAITFSGSALADVVLQRGDGGNNHGGGGNNSGPNSELNIYQYGGGNSALALQTDTRNSDLTTTQHGSDNGTDVGQGSDDSSIDLAQRDFGNSTTLDQQDGKDPTVTVKQFSGGNGAAVDQTASNSSINVTQVSLGNNATAHQYQYIISMKETGRKPCFFSGEEHECVVTPCGIFQSDNL